MGRGTGTAAARRRKGRTRPAVDTTRGVHSAQPGQKGQPIGGREVAADGDEPQALSVTHWFDAAATGDANGATIRFTGRRVGIQGKPRPADTFVKEEDVTGVVPGSGPIAVTTWVYGLSPGEWTVTAELLRRRNPLVIRPTDRRGHGKRASLPRAGWSWWRWALTVDAYRPVKTRWAPLVRLTRMPAVIPGSWIALVGLGVLVGALVQATILSAAGIPVGRALVVDLLALLAGLAGAKALYVALRRGSWRRSIAEGWSVDGFLVITPLVATITLLSLDLPIGTFFDASAPALFFGVAIGRLGCFFTGCCAGRCTRSRWGVWSSDRRIGARRIPTQLLESAAGLLIGTAALFVVATPVSAGSGAVFVAAVAAYVLARQVLLRLRAEPHDAVRARVTAVVAGIVLVAMVVTLAVGTPW